MTLADLARATGVSTATVSNAYNRPEKLSAGLRQRILDTARSLGYPGPDPTARGLRRGHTGTLGVLYADRLSYAFADPGYVLFLRGVSAAAETAGLALTLVPAGPRDRRSASAIDTIAVDGFIIYSMAPDDPLVSAAVERRLPIVVTDQPRLETAPFVGIDDASAARSAAEHLLGLGHRRLGVISLELGVTGQGGLADAERLRAATSPMVRARLQGYGDAATSAGLSWPRDVPVYECAENLPEEGERAARALLSAPEPPSALLAMSDQLALGVLDAAAGLGLAVPDDLSLVGFDDTTWAERAADVALTTVRQPHFDKGRYAGEALIASLAGQPVEPRQLLPTELVARATTQAPRAISPPVRG
ncbi:substrate-binding domain-containing protein [Salinactinospora qingdaonensis]|uniref:Substrate-binding domain-containing protein n=1 Tax=Salinactinospora qingdaonensis TaxID=702744 RepID=A0ABP7FG58_9ACTN